MHIYRRRARSLAWYDDDEERPSRNPFKKFRPHPTRSRTSALETGQIPPDDSDRTEFDSPHPSLTAHSTVAPSTSGTDAPAGAGLFASRQGGNADSITSADPLTSQKTRGIDSSAGQTAGKDGGERERSEKEIQSGVAVGQQPVPKDEADKPSFTLVSQLRATLLNSWINVLLFAAPAGIIIHYLHVDAVAIFVVNFIAIIPLAAMLSYATEEIAIRTGETLGGLLNATFGNAVELIVSIIALFKDQIIIVQTSLIGSMLSNLLLVLGMSFFAGGVNRVEQNFNVTVAQTASSLLSLAVGSLIIPTAFHAWSDAGEEGIAPLSRGTSIILLFVYAAYLFFQLKTHAEMYNKPSEKVEKRTKKVEAGDATKGIAQIGAGMSAAMGGKNAQHNPVVVPEDEEQPQLHILVAFLTLAVSTTLVAFCAEAMVSSIDAITERSHISETFVGLILLPIVGNAAEHATAVTVAVKDKMDLAIGVAVGSSMQIAMLVLPFLVVLGWIAGKDDMTLYFDGFQIAILFIAVLLVNYLIQDGKSHWLEGVQLMTLYIIIAVAAWFYPHKSEPQL